jgi:Zn-dependent alcohol dehydrogenase
MRYRTAIVTKGGGLAVLQVIDNDLRAPLAGEASITMVATPMCQDDVASRIGNRPSLPEIPFVRAYSILAVVDAIGEGLPRIGLVRPMRD